MENLGGIKWTNNSVLRMASGDNPIEAIEKRVRDLVLRAKDEGWDGPPFSPIAIADILKIPVEANADIPDARTISTKDGLKIQFNPTQARARVRFSLAHEIAHTLFSDVGDKVRNRGGSPSDADDWQLEILCNLAAAEIVMPIGSLPARKRLPKIEELMIERLKFDVSAEAFLIRVTKITEEPVIMFCTSPMLEPNQDAQVQYRINYTVRSKTAPHLQLSGKLVPSDSAVYSCTAIGFTERRKEKWILEKPLIVECVGIPSFPGNSYPRVAGIIRLTRDYADADQIKFLHGNVLEPRGTGPMIICQLVNDKARRWGGGVAKSAAKMYPKAQEDFSNWISMTPLSKRLGEIHFAHVDDSKYIASLVAQKGYGPSSSPRIRYSALERCLLRVASLAKECSATVHMPRIGAGLSGGSWATVEEIIREILVESGISVTVYDLPPKHTAATSELFD